MNNKKYILVSVILSLLIIVSAVFYFFENSRLLKTQSIQILRASTYVNKEYGFEIRYPSNFTATTTFQRYYALGDSWRADALLDDNDKSRGESLVSIPVYRVDNHTGGAYVSYPLYYDAELRIGASSDPKDVQTCLLSTNEILPETGSTEMINGITFSKFIIQNAGMSQYIGGVSYRTIHNNICFAVEQLKAGSSYRDMPNPKDIPDSVLDSYFNEIPAIIKTFKFIEADVSGASNDQNTECVCRDGYVKDGDSCTPKCYYSTPKCLMPSYICLAR